jgi:hypothetical protein
MKNQLILTLTILLSAVQQRITVNEQITTIEIKKNFPITSRDSVIKYKKSDYSVRAIENFDKDGSVNCVRFSKSEGWLEFKRDEFSRIKDFLKSNDLKPKLECQIIGKKLIKINADTITYDSLNTDRRIIYYFEKNNHKRLSILKF